MGYLILILNLDFASDAELSGVTSGPAGYSFHSLSSPYHWSLAIDKTPSSETGTSENKCSFFLIDLDPL
jgi:hypothetical protein